MSAETVKLGNYSVSFNLSQPHETVIDDNFVEVKTFDEPVTVAILQDETINPTGEYITVDGQRGAMSIIEDDIGYIYIIRYEVGSACARVISRMPFFETADFLRSLHVEKENC